MNTNITPLFAVLLGIGISSQVFAQGTIVYFDPPDTTLYSDGADIKEEEIDINSDGIADYNVVALNVFRIEPANNNKVIATRLSGELSRYVDPISYGSEIGSVTQNPSEWIGTEQITINGNTTLLYPSFHSRSTIGTVGPWQDGVEAYVGIEFEISGSTHYGWIGISIPDLIGQSPNGGVITDWAYNSVPGESILAGQVPEPSAWALMAGGLVTFGLFRLWRAR